MDRFAISSGHIGARQVAFEIIRIKVKKRTGGITSKRMNAGTFMPKSYSEKRKDSRGVSCRVWNSMGLGRSRGPAFM